MSRSNEPNDQAEHPEQPEQGEADATAPSRVPRWMAKRVAAAAKLRGVRIDQMWALIAGQAVRDAWAEAVALDGAACPAPGR